MGWAWWMMNYILWDGGGWDDCGEGNFVLIFSRQIDTRLIRVDGCRHGDGAQSWAYGLS